MMWKKTLVSLLLFSSATMAKSEKHSVSAPALDALKQQWTQAYQQAQQTLVAEREQFLQLEALLKNAEKQGKLSDRVLALAKRLISDDYPLKPDADWLIFKTLVASERFTPEQLEHEVAQFAAQYPLIAKRNRLAQLPYTHYYQAQKLPELIAYSQAVPPETMDNMCRVFAAKFQLLAEKTALNPEAEQAGSPANASPEMAELLTAFDTFWQGKIAQQNEKLGEAEASYWRKNAFLPLECGGIEAYWRDQGLKTAAKIQQKALYLFQLGAKPALVSLNENSQDPELNGWLSALEKLLAEPKNLQHFVQNQPLTEVNRRIIEKAFPAFVRTLAEQMDNPNFSVYQGWAEKWGLSEETQKAWKMAFISRVFDNLDPAFQLWRDEQLLALKADQLTERRLRTAIFQQTPLKPWLDNLTPQAKEKAEWRYWQAKADPKQRNVLLNALATERGFYPMLAAHALGKPYTLNLPSVVSLTPHQQAQFTPALERVRELRALKRFEAAKTAWIDLLQAVSFDEKIALTDYANGQSWVDLAVEGTIQAKAWDYVQLRLPNAYAQWFDLHLTDHNITKTFAMAIARQESAWNAQARSHANAQGLMQMLPSTAKQTADNQQLPFSERDLLDPFKNIMLGTAHLAELNEKYPNNRILIAAAYNAGAHRVKTWLERAGGRLAMDEFIVSIPFLETRGYVQNVLAYDYYYQILQEQPQKVMFSQEEASNY
ncbi:lytic murein transglycosylase [[Actinobacillus] muris]|uniref:Lytic murein transglycosylase n=2 Tax=Muribacter muris TaxID=67855 RepID=A0A0J5S0T2_9PAST|nr:lytic murein transglycosylase [[Actinobacillus] muris] [Muribacter muris]